MYTTARCIFGWSDEEFWKATPRMYFAVLYKFAQIKQMSTPKEEVLVGQDALQALSSMARKVR